MADAKQTALKARYVENVKQFIYPDSPRMVEYLKKEAAYIVEFENGTITAIEKPRIKTRFCFGYSDSRYNTDDYDRANEMAYHARTDEGYFIRENLAGFDETLHKLEHPESSDVHGDYYTRASHYGQPKDCPIIGVTWISNSQYAFAMTDEDRARNTPLTGEDRARYIEGVKTVREAFVKRLNTYLKKYGMSKIHSWSYWRDE